MERGIKLSKINATFKQAFDLTPLLGELQQQGLVKIIFDPSKEPGASYSVNRKRPTGINRALF